MSNQNKPGWNVTNGRVQRTRAVTDEGKAPTLFFEQEFALSAPVFLGGVNILPTVGVGLVIAYRNSNSGNPEVTALRIADGAEVYAVDASDNHPGFTYFGGDAPFVAGRIWVPLIKSSLPRVIRWLALNPETGAEEFFVDVTDADGNVSLISSASNTGVGCTSNDEALLGMWRVDPTALDDNVELALFIVDSQGQVTPVTHTVVAFPRPDGGDLWTASWGSVGRLADMVSSDGLHVVGRAGGTLNLVAVNDAGGLAWQLGAGSVTPLAPRDQLSGDEGLFEVDDGGAPRTTNWIDVNGNNAGPLYTGDLVSRDVVLADESGRALVVRKNVRRAQLPGYVGLDWQENLDQNVIQNVAPSFGNHPRFVGNKLAADVSAMFGRELDIDVYYKTHMGRPPFELASISLLTGAEISTADISSETKTSMAWIGGSGSTTQTTWTDGSAPTSLSLGDLSQLLHIFGDDPTTAPSDVDLFLLVDGANSWGQMPSMTSAIGNARVPFSHLGLALTFVDDTNGEIDSCFGYFLPYADFVPEVQISTLFHAINENGGDALDLADLPSAIRINVSGTPQFHSLSVGDRILVNDQQRAGGGGYTANGLYEVTDVSPTVVVTRTTDTLQVGSCAEERNLHASILHRLTQETVGLGTSFQPGDSVSNGGDDQLWDQHADLRQVQHFDQTLNTNTNRGRALIVPVTWTSGFSATAELGGTHVEDLVTASGDSIIYSTWTAPGTTGALEYYANGSDDIEALEDVGQAVLAEDRLFTRTHNPGDSIFTWRGVRARTWPGLADLWSVDFGTVSGMVYYNGLLYVASGSVIRALNPETGSVVRGPFTAGASLSRMSAGAAGVWNAESGKVRKFIDFLSLDELERRSCGKDCEPKNSTANGFGLCSITIGGELFYTQCNFSAPASSLGFGWSHAAYKNIEEVNGDLVFKDGSGSFERWELILGSYVPAHRDNYSTIVKNGDDTFTLTHPDASVMEFDTLANGGRILTWTDRNNNVITYTYGVPAGPDTQERLLMIDDGEGREQHFEYLNRTDGQPTKIRSQTPQVGSAREINYLYYDNTALAPDRLHKIIDAVGDETEFIYYQDGRLHQIKDARQNVSVEYTYAGDGRIATETFYGERRNTISYNDTLATMTLVEEDLTPNPEASRTTVLQFDEFRNLVKKTDPIGNVFEYQYKDPFNPYLMTKQINPNLTEMSYTYNQQGNLATSTDAQGNVTRYDYVEDFVENPPVQLRNLLRFMHRPEVSVNGVNVTYTTEFVYNQTTGNLEEIVDPADQSTYFTVSTKGLVEAITDRNGHTTAFLYSVWDEFNPDSESRNGQNLKRITEPGTAARKTHFVYNDFDEVIEVRDNAGNSWNTEYDAVGRPISTKDARQKVTSFEYISGLLEHIDLPTNQGVGVENGRTIDMVKVRRTTNVYETTIPRLEQVKRDISGSSQEMRVKHKFSAFGNLKELTRLMNSTEKTTTFNYDQLDRTTASQLPGKPASSATYATYCTEFTTVSPRGISRKTSFDSRCQMTMLETDSEDHEMEYDELGRLVKLTQVEKTPYGQAGVSPPRRPGRFGSACYQECREVRTFEYDELDRLTKVTLPNNETILYQYDFEGNLTQVTDTEGGVTQYSYLEDNRLEEVTVDRGVNDQVFSYSYDTAGRLEKIVYPAATGIEARFYGPGSEAGWDENGNLRRLFYYKSGARIQSFEYQYDDSGNRISLVDTPANSANAVTWTYAYDWLDRLVEVKKDGNPYTAYVYDESDNRIQLDISALNEVHTYTYNTADEILTRSVAVGGGGATLTDTFNHDDDGNMIARTVDPGGQNEATTLYHWDDKDKLYAIETPSKKVVNLYDSGGQRKKRVGDDGVKLKSFYSGLPTLSESSSSGDSFSWVMAHGVAGFELNGSFSWFITDGLGSVRVLVDGDGDEIAAVEFDEFGNKIASSGSGSTSKTFVGGLGVIDETEDTGLYLMSQRWMDPTIGRFINRDPIGYAGGLNLYDYSTNPINSVDPSGLGELGTLLEGVTTDHNDTFRNTPDFIATIFMTLTPGMGFLTAQSAGGYLLAALDFVPGERILSGMLQAGKRAFTPALSIGRRGRMHGTLNLGGGGKPCPDLFPNQMPEGLASELATARSVGAVPISPGTEAFTAAVNEGTLKWVVTAEDALLVTPKHVQGVEISHAVLSGGRAVRTAGEADVAMGAGQFFGIEIFPWSGHFRPTRESVETIGRAAFRKFGIEFP